MLPEIVGRPGVGSPGVDSLGVGSPGVDSLGVDNTGVVLGSLGGLDNPETGTPALGVDIPVGGCPDIPALGQSMAEEHLEKDEGRKKIKPASI